MPRYSTNTYSDPDAPRLPWWAWVLLLALGVGVLKLTEGCRRHEPPLGSVHVIGRIIQFR